MVVALTCIAIEDVLEMSSGRMRDGAQIPKKVSPFGASLPDTVKRGEPNDPLQGRQESNKSDMYLL